MFQYDFYTELVVNHGIQMDKFLHIAFHLISQTRLSVSSFKRSP
jgi:hypothetical protein